MGLSRGDRVDRYEILEFLGAGGMGEVYRARDPKLARFVALKVIQPDDDPSKGAMARLLREGRASAALSHANVVAVYDVGAAQVGEPSGELAYIAMELVDGKPLRAYFGDPNITLATRLRWLRDIASALAAAHQVGIVHRDVKPENVMVRADGVVKVLDFGIARRVMSAVERLATTGGQGILIAPALAPREEAVVTLAEQGKALGTPYYMAPEQLRAEAADPRTDQFSWGILAYELLTGIGPWQMSPNLGVTVSEILSRDPRPPIELEPKIPSHVSDAIGRALEKQRADRFPSMNRLLSALENPGLRATATPSHPAPRPRRAPGLHFGTAAITLVLGGLAAAGIAGTRGIAHWPPVADAPRAAPRCSNGSCSKSHHDEPYLCRASDQTCVAVASEDCTPMFDPQDLGSDDTVWLGAMFAKAEASDRMNMEGANFAREEIAQAKSAIESSKEALRVRRIALVGCDDSVNASRAARHLIDDLGVPAVFSFQSEKEEINLASSLLRSHRVITVGSLTGVTQVTRLPQAPDLPAMDWRTTASVDRTAEATAHLLEYVVESRRPTGANRLTLLCPAESFGCPSFARTFSRVLHFNGKLASENEEIYQEIASGQQELSKENIANISAQIRAHRPRYVIATGISQPSLLAIMNDIETTPDGDVPTYIVPLRPMMAFTEFLDHDFDRRHRLLTVQSTGSSFTNARFVMRYNDAHSEHVSREVNPAAGYDAFYVLAYATFALGREPITGPSLARAIARLVPPGPPIDVGPTGLYRAIGLLTSGSQIDLQGAATTLDFDLSTGEIPTDFALVCSGLGPDGGASGENVESGVVLKANATRAQGTMHCP